MSNVGDWNECLSAKLHAAYGDSPVGGLGLGNTAIEQRSKSWLAI